MTGPGLHTLDTSILMHLIRGDALADRIEERCRLRSRPFRPIISIVSHAEIWVLARRNGWGEKKRARLRAMLDNVVTVDTAGPGVVDAYVDLELASQNVSAGSVNMQDNDLWIAATAKATGSILLTTDRDFDHLHPEHVERICFDPDDPLSIRD